MTLFEELAVTATCLLASQTVMPIFIGKPVFWVFRKNQVSSKDRRTMDYVHHEEIKRYIEARRAEMAEKSKQC